MLLGYITIIFPKIALLSLMVYLPLFLFWKLKYGKQPLLHHLAAYGLIGVLLSILYATVFTSGTITFNPPRHILNLIPFAWLGDVPKVGWKIVLNGLILNVLMFVPFGALLPMVFPRVSKFFAAALCSLVLTASIEGFQYFIGRACDIDDIMANLLGGILGYILFAALRKLFRGWKRQYQPAGLRQRYDKKALPMKKQIASLFI